MRRSFRRRTRALGLIRRQRGAHERPELVLHIGTHKTGTTSFQNSIHVAAGTLAATGVHAFDSPLSQVRSWAHELPLAVARPSLELPARRLFPEYASGDRIDMLRAHIAAQVGPEHESVLMSQEALSLLRTDDELELLRDLLLGRVERRPRVVVTLRERTSYLTSMTAQLQRSGVWRENPAKDSISYLEPDSWLVDYQTMIDLYQRHFGGGSVTVVPYERSIARDGSILPALWEACGIGHLLGRPDDLWLNRSPTNDPT